MPLKKLAYVALAAVLTLAAPLAVAQDTAVTIDPAIAAMSVDQLVEARQAAMKQDGGILKGAGALTGAEAVAAATTLLQNFTNFPALFPEGAVNEKSGALPLVWTEFDKFSAIFARDAVSSQAMLAAAQNGDAAAYTAALKEIGSTCGECHQTYRKPR